MENDVQSNIPPVQPPPQTPSPVSHFNIRSKILLFTVLGFIIVAGSVFVGTQIGKDIPTQTIVNPTVSPTVPNPTTNPTANWKLFEDKKYHFSIKVPEYFNLEPITDPPWSANTWYYSEDDKIDVMSIKPLVGDPESVWMSVDGKSERLKNFIISYHPNIQFENYKTERELNKNLKFIQEKQINNATVFTALTWGMSDFLDDDRITGFSIPIDNNTLIIQTNHYKDNQKDADILIGQILSTFEFIQ